ncbi:hypothetical protein [Roseicella frigidaeris]|uniref:hypothetical protein n=1 Tax=Roseicella frigidaeris TaxID=2230885 RepID=UPI000FDEC12F|nr:hypothetical protein [Roseicella frigidaeris]
MRVRAAIPLAIALGIAWPAAAQTPAAEPAAAPAIGPEAAGPVLNLVQRGIPAEASAENGVLARERALAAGRRTAWERLATEAGTTAPNLSDSQIDNMVSSIVIEQERTSPTRYAGRITVNFNGNRVRGALAGRVPGLAPPAAAAGGATATPGGPASNWVDAVAIYHSMGEWLEMLRRLKGAGPVASVELRAIAVDAARVRLGLRAPVESVAGDLGGLGLQLAPAVGTRPGEAWRLVLAGGP